MKISVLIAASRAGPQLAEALATVRAQVHAAWELIVVEYGPPDRTMDIVRDFGLTAGRPVRYDHIAEGKGIAAARNRLLELASGDPIAFLDPSDRWTPRHLANAAQHLAPGADLAVSDLRLLEGRRGPTDIAPTGQLLTNPVRALFAHDAVPSVSCVTFRRELADRAGVFDERFGVAEDRDFWLRCALKNGRFAATHRATCQRAKIGDAGGSRSLALAENTVLFYEKHRDLPAVPAALRRRLLAASLVAHGRLLRRSDPTRAARCFWRAWSLQPVHVQTLGQFALTGWRSSGIAEPRRSGDHVGNETASNDS